MPVQPQRPSQHWRSNSTALMSSSTSSSPSPSPSPSTARFPIPSRISRHSRSSSRRLSDGVSRSAFAQGRSYLRKGWDAYCRWGVDVMDTYHKLPALHRGFVLAMVIIGWIFIILSVLYSKAFFAWLATVSEVWRKLPGGWLIAFLLVCVTSVPPVIGYSTANTITGFVYGFPMGWPIAASACVFGSFVAFVLCRTVLSSHVHKLIGNDHRFVALSQVLRRDGLLYLTGIRFCPLPFSLSNGFLATIPSITPTAFILSTALSTPKLLIHIFIGSRVAIIAEGGDGMSLGDKFINYASMIVGGAIGAAAGIIIYRRTMARAAELAREEDVEAADEGDGGYEDNEDTLMDPEDAAEIMGNDDLSLWETQVEDDWNGRDATTNDENGKTWKAQVGKGGS